MERSKSINSNIMPKCYMCSREGTTKEHVPPRSFFPKSHRENLITVPSCELHNNNNSKDVEYIRNIIVHHFETNELAREHFSNKVNPSYSRSPKLKERTFRKRKDVLLNGQETIVFKAEMYRFNVIIRAIAFAIYFKDFGKTFNEDWHIYSPSMIASKAVFENLDDPYNPKVREIIRSATFAKKETSNPNIFKYSELIDSKNRIIYKFEFYEGFEVIAMSMTISQLVKLAHTRRNPSFYKSK